ncbi:MAG: guanitoxin biosynthesis heme-dependent pre-guanitoxin N-hydroxylase GntA [Ferruginibacter sp.]
MLLQKEVAKEYTRFLRNRDYPCVAARAAAEKQTIKTFSAGNMACPTDDKAILDFLYVFVDNYRISEGVFHSAAIIFEQPALMDDEMFDKLMWQRLQSLADLDAALYPFDKRVSNSVTSENFSFSLKSEAFFILGLHPGSSRISRQFTYPALVFNPHAAFDLLRSNGQYEKMKAIVRKRELHFSGSLNPMLDDFGKTSEVYQYSGKEHPADWQCPLQINHGKTTNNTAA